MITFAATEELNRGEKLYPNVCKFQGSSFFMKIVRPQFVGKGYRKRKMKMKINGKPKFRRTFKYRRFT